MTSRSRVRTATAAKKVPTEQRPIEPSETTPANSSAMGIRSISKTSAKMQAVTACTKPRITRFAMVFPSSTQPRSTGARASPSDGVVFEFDRKRSTEAEQRREHVGDPEQPGRVGAGRGRRTAGQREVEDHDHQHREEQHRDRAVAAVPFGEQVLPENGEQCVHATPRSDAAEYAFSRILGSSCSPDSAMCDSSAPQHHRRVGEPRREHYVVRNPEPACGPADAAPSTARRVDPRAVRSRPVKGSSSNTISGSSIRPTAIEEALRHPAREAARAAIRGSGSGPPRRVVLQLARPNSPRPGAERRSSGFLSR